MSSAAILAKRIGCACATVRGQRADVAAAAARRGRWRPVDSAFAPLLAPIIPLRRGERTFPDSIWRWMASGAHSGRRLQLGAGRDGRAVYRRPSRHGRAAIATRAPPFCRAAPQVVADVPAEQATWPASEMVTVCGDGGRHVRDGQNRHHPVVVLWQCGPGCTHQRTAYGRRAGSLTAGRLPNGEPIIAKIG